MPNLTIIILLIILATLVLGVFIYERVVDSLKGDITLESVLTRLDSKKTYKFTFKLDMFHTQTLEIKPEEEHITVMNENKQYNQRKDVYINVSVQGMTVYSAYLKDVSQIEVIENSEEE